MDYRCAVFSFTMIIVIYWLCFIIVMARNILIYNHNIYTTWKLLRSLIVMQQSIVIYWKIIIYSNLERSSIFSHVSHITQGTCKAKYFK